MTLEGNTSILRVVLLEDQPEIRQGLERLIASDVRLSLVASCSTLSEAKEAVDRGLLFEIALVDLGLPDGSGIEFIARLHKERPLCSSVVFTQLETDDAIFDSLSHGAVGYILKSAPLSSLSATLIEAARGGSPMTPSIARRVLSSFRPRVSNQNDRVDSLSEREREVLIQLSQGASYLEIAQKLSVSLSTVQTFIKRIYGKLHVNNKAEASSIAASSGLHVASGPRSSTTK
jgi:DNA-binding NarL/FixJ family response regulator